MDHITVVENTGLLQINIKKRFLKSMGLQT